MAMVKGHKEESYNKLSFFTQIISNLAWGKQINQSN